MVRGAVQKVGDHSDVSGDFQLAARICLEAFRDRRDSVRLVDAERDRFRVRPVAPEQRDIRAVERGDDRRHVADRSVARRGENLSGEVGRGRVRHRIMGVDDVELFVPGHLHNLVGQR